MDAGRRAGPSGGLHWVVGPRARTTLCDSCDKVPFLVLSGPPIIVPSCRPVQIREDEPIRIETPQVQLETPPLIPSSSPSAPARAPLAMAATLHSNITPFEMAGAVTNFRRL